MDVRMMDKLKDKLCEELGSVSRKNGMTSTDLDNIHKLTDTIKNLEKIKMYEGEGGQSERRYSRDGGSYGSYNNGSYNNGSYDGGTSYGRHWVTGHYSRDDSRQMLREQMQKTMNDGDLSPDQRRAIEDAMRAL